MKVLGVVIAAITCLAVAIISPSRFVIGINEISVLGMVLYLSKLIVYALPAYVLSNHISARTRPPRAWGTDFTFSALATASLTVTAYHVWRTSPVGNVEQFLNLPHDVQALFVMAGYSLYDITVNQLRSWQEASAALGRLAFAGILIAVLVLIGILMFGLDLSKIRSKIADPERACTTTYKFVGYNIDGKKLYLCD